MHREAPWYLLLLAFLLLAGCAGKAPETTPLARNEREQVEAGFTEFAKRVCPLSLDADIAMEMQILGKTEKSAGMLQYEGPSSLRYAIVDPLGRSLFIIATDGYTFTMVYNREAKAVTGSTASRFWQDYVPQGVAADDIVLLLAGHLPADLRQKDIRGDRDGAGFWLYAAGSEGIRHEILFDHRVSRVLRHILRDGNGTVLYDVTYEQYGAGDPLCPLPSVLRVEGKTITGTVILRFDRLFTGQAIPPQTFHITPPGHFLVQQVE
jgi:hypothetical protein